MQISSIYLKLFSSFLSTFILRSWSKQDKRCRTRQRYKKKDWLLLHFFMHIKCFFFFALGLHYLEIDAAISQIIVEQWSPSFLTLKPKDHNNMDYNAVVQRSTKEYDLSYKDEKGRMIRWWRFCFLPLKTCTKLMQKKRIVSSSMRYNKKM